MTLIPIEILLEKSEQREAYDNLSKNFNDIVPYVGTGLSFYCQGWGFPFERIISTLKSSTFVSSTCFFDKLTTEQRERAEKALVSLTKETKKKNITCLKNCLSLAVSYINKHSSDQITFDFPRSGGEINNMKIWDAIDNLYECEHYLELGELLNLISYTLSGEQFNLRFYRVINALEVNAKNEYSKNRRDAENLAVLGNMGPLPPAVWYLPYFGHNSNFVITTNTDNSLRWVYNELGTKVLSFSGKSKPGDIPQDNCVIFHIHGYQPKQYLNTSNTFIMTWRDYKDAYEDEDGCHKEILIERFKNGHFLFIGASLDKDTTVELMKKQAGHDSSIDRHVAFLSDGDNIAEKIIELNSTMATQAIVTPHWTNYPSVLCHIVREKLQKEWNVEDLFSDIKLLDDAYKKDSLVCELSSFLSKPDYKDLYKELSEEDVKDKLLPLIKKEIYDSRTRTFKWDVCRVDNDDFCFPISSINKDDSLKLFSYSAPLGSTIYILGGSESTQKKRDELADKILRWADLHEKDYWDKTTVKIRVILVKNTGTLTPESIIDELLDVICCADSDEAERKLEELIGEMYKYATYKDAFNMSLEKALERLKTIGLSQMVVSMFIEMQTKDIFKECHSQMAKFKNAIITLGSKVWGEEMDDEKTRRLTFRED